MAEFVPLAPRLQCCAIQRTGSGICWLSSGGLYSPHLNVLRLLCLGLGVIREFSPHPARRKYNNVCRSQYSRVRKARVMAFTGVLKLKFGPFWFKTTILLVNVVGLGRNAKYVLRVERPSICGGRIDLPIGRRDFPIHLLPRSDNDRRKLRFGIQYGVKGKTIRFLAPNAEVYRHWIAALRDAFHRSVKVLRRARNETASTIETGGSGSDNDSRVHAVGSRFVTDSTRGQRGSDALDMSISEYMNHIGPDTDLTNGHDTNYNLHQEVGQREQSCDVVPHVISKAKQQDVLRRDADIEDSSNTESSGGLTPVAKAASAIRSQDSFSTDSDFGKGQQNVYCMATDRNGVTSFSVYTPSKAARVGQAPRHERVFKLASTEWARWMARDIRENEILPEVFHLTSTSCKRLQVPEIVAIAQPFFE